MNKCICVFARNSVTQRHSSGNTYFKMYTQYVKRLWCNQRTALAFHTFAETSCVWWKCRRKDVHILVQNCTLTLKPAGLSLIWKNIWRREFNSSSPHNRNQLLMLSSSEFFSSLARKSFSTHQHSHLTLMAPSAVLADSTWNNTETLVTVKGFNPECFSTDSRGTCADIPGILRWIAPFPGSTVCDGTEADLLNIHPKPHMLLLWPWTA